MKLSKIALSLGLIVPSVAFGAMVIPTPSLSNAYVGGDVGHSIAGLKANKKRVTPRSKSVALNAYAGYKFTENFALEGGLFTNASTLSKKQKKAGKVALRHTGAHLGAVASTPVVGSLEAMVGAGASFIKAHAKKIAGYSTKKTTVSPRLMAGLQYPVALNTNIRAGVVYNRLRSTFNRSKNPTLKMNDSYHLSVGLNYLF